VAPRSTETAPRLRSHAFGIVAESEREIVGLPATPSPTGATTRIEIAAAGAKPAPAGEEVRLAHGPGGEVTLSVHRDEEGNYLLELRGAGAYLIAADGLRVTCFPEAGVEDWRWQRAIVNQVLPLAATVRGLEVLHAGAVSLNGSVVALVGHPGAGKSSTTLNLILRGARFFTDDALAIERAADGILAHPGAAVSNFPRSERDLMASEERRRLGAVIGGEEDFKSLLAPSREERSLPLGALYFLRRGSGAAHTRFEPTGDGAAAMLLGSTYVLSVRSRRRLANQLDLCAAVAATTPIFDVLIPETVTARESAAALLAHAEAAIAGSAP
jgi:hypothetical protein